MTNLVYNTIPSQQLTLQTPFRSNLRRLIVLRRGEILTKGILSVRRWVLAMVQLSGTGDEMESAQIPIGGSSRVRARLPTHEILAMGDQHPSTTSHSALSQTHTTRCVSSTASPPRQLFRAKDACSAPIPSPRRKTVTCTNLISSSCRSKTCLKPSIAAQFRYHVWGRQQPEHPHQMVRPQLSCRSDCISVVERAHAETLFASTSFHLCSMWQTPACIMALCCLWSVVNHAS